MSITLILIIVASGIGLGSFIWIKILYNQKKHLTFKLNYAENEIRSLRGTIREMAILEGEKQVVRTKKDKVKKDNSELNDDELNIAYANKLHNIPTRKTN